MPLNCGIVGLPNVGKSTIFNALTAAKAQAANYPFCTIDPNVGVVSVPDVRLDRITQFVKPNRTVPTTMEFIDIAGLVEGASKGEGLGNQFLGHIRSTDAICHVVRCFDDPNVIHVAGGVNPLHDIDIINTELLLADLDTVEKRWAKVEKAVKNTTDPKIKAEAEALKKLLEAIQAGRPARVVDLTEEEKAAAYDLHLITMKPVLYVANVDEAGLKSGNAWVSAVEKRAAEENAQVVSICGALEAEIALLEPAERTEFLTDLGLTEPGLDRLIHSAYRLLGLITYFTAGVQEVRAWTIPIGAKAPQAAGVIHTTSSAASSRPTPTTPRSFSHTAANKPSRKKASTAPRARNTPSKTATSSSSNSTCSGVPHPHDIVVFVVRVGCLEDPHANSVPHLCASHLGARVGYHGTSTRFHSCLLSSHLGSRTT